MVLADTRNSLDRVEGMKRPALVGTAGPAGRECRVRRRYAPGDSSHPRLRSAHPDPVRQRFHRERLREPCIPLNNDRYRDRVLSEPGDEQHLQVGPHLARAVGDLASVDPDGQADIGDQEVDVRLPTVRFAAPFRVVAQIRSAGSSHTRES